MEDYEKKYKDALNKAKDMLKRNEVSQENMEYLFSELKESEDEKIKRCIEICLLADANEQRFKDCDTTIKDCLDWIENQSETVEINPTEFDLRLNKLLKQFKILPKDDIIDTLNFYLNVARNDGTYKADENQNKFVDRKELKKVEQDDRLLQYITKERNKVDFYYNDKKVSWNDIPYEVRRHDYPYHFIGDLDCFPFFVDEY